MSPPLEVKKKKNKKKKKKNPKKKQKKIEKKTGLGKTVCRKPIRQFYNPLPISFEISLKTGFLNWFKPFFLLMLWIIFMWYEVLWLWWLVETCPCCRKMSLPSKVIFRRPPLLVVAKLQRLVKKTFDGEDIINKVC